MNRNERTQILVHCEAKALRKMALIVEEATNVKILEAPNSGLVMIKMRESAKKCLFYLGEVLVTECKVLIEDSIGLGILQGSHSKKAYYLAVIDAAYNHPGILNESIIQALNASIESEKIKQLIQKEIKVSQLLRTKVDFTTLDEEVKA